MNSVRGGKSYGHESYRGSKVEVSLENFLSESWCNGKRTGLVIRTRPLCHLLGVPPHCLIGLSFLIS